MKHLLFIAFLTIGLSLNAQSINYNTEKGFIAEGHDVVAYFNNQVKKGNSKYVATFDSIKLKFSSQENLNTFKADPEKYVPQYGGWCAYALGAKNKKVSIDPETYEIREGKLFLFYNSWGNNTLESWLESPESLKIKADKNWEVVKNKS